jgi:hypothetical protein
MKSILFATKVLRSITPTMSEMNHLIRKANYRQALELLERDGVNSIDEEGDTVLHAAVKNSSYCIKHLVHHYGANPNIPDAKGNLPLHVAVQHKKYDFVDTLLSCGAQPNLHNDQTGYTPLHEAAKMGNYIPALILMRYGANIDAPRIHYSALETPLSISINYGHETFTKFLVSLGAMIHPRMTDDPKYSHFRELFKEMTEIDAYCVSSSLRTCLEQARIAAEKDGVACARILVNIKSKLVESGREVSKQEMKEILHAIPSYNVYAKLAISNIYAPEKVAIEISHSELLGHIPESSDFSVS